MTDKLPSRLNLLIGSSSWIVGMFLFAISTFFRELDANFWWVAHLSLLLNGFGCALMFFTFMRLVYQIPRTEEFQGYHEYVIAFLSLSFDSTIAYAIYLIARFGNVRLFYAFNGLILLVLPAMVTITLFYDLPNYQEEKTGENQKLILNNENENESQVTTENVEIVEEKKISLMASLVHPGTIMLFLFIINVVQSQSWFLTTIYDQVLFRSKDKAKAEFHNSIFGLMYPIVGAISNLLFGRIVQNLKHGFIVLFFLSLGFTTVRYLPNVDVQFLMYFFWIPWRSCAFTFYYAAFPLLSVSSDYKMSLTAFGFSLGGCIALLTIFYNWIVEKLFDGNFLYLNIGLDSFNLFIHVVILIFFSKIK